MPYTRSSIADDVLPHHKTAVWRAIGGGARLTYEGIAKATGINVCIVFEVIAMAHGRDMIRFVDHGVGDRWIEQKLPGEK